jgi:hypothetical protein
VEARRFTAHIDELHNQEYRVKYLLNEIKKEDIEQVLINQERKRERHRVIREVMDTFGNVGAEIFRRFIADATAKGPTSWDDLWPTYRAELEGLRDYCNNELLTISYYYKCSVPQWCTENWSITNQSEADMRRTERNRVLAAYQKLKDTKATHAPVSTVAPAVPVVMPTITIPNIPGIPDLVIKLPAVEPGTAATPK